MTGVRIDTAENGKEAVDKIEKFPEDWYNLVFMDIQMPVMNGYETTAAIRTLSGKRGSIPIVARQPMRLLRMCRWLRIPE